MIKKHPYRLLFIVLPLFLLSCNPSRHLPEGQYLLNRNRIEIEDANIDASRLPSYYRQRPNRRILGVYRFHLNVYQLADRGRDTRIKRWMKRTIGEPPVLYDPAMTQNTLRQFELYMSSRGYFNADVGYEESTRGKRMKVTYQIEGNTPYTLKQITYSITDPYLEGYILRDSQERLVQPGQRYDADKLQDERNRMARHLRDAGFFQFSRDFISFQIDSNLNSHQVNVEIAVSNPQRPVPGFRDSVQQISHRRFIIDQVLILPEYSPLQADMPRQDTTLFLRSSRRQELPHPYIFLHNGPLRIKPSAIANHLLIRPGSFYRQTDVETSYSFLSGMRNFRYINLSFAESREPALGTPSDTLGFLDARVQLNRSAAHAFTVEAEGLNTGGNLGVASNLLYQNRNVFAGAEIFNLRFKGALEVSGEGRSEEVIQRLPFNTLELGVEAGIDFPKLLLPFNLERLSRNARPKSSVVTGINFRQRPDYTRYVLNLSYGFEWNETPQKRHFINPVEISSIRVYNDSILRANIPDGNPFILSRFRDHFILGMKHTYIFNTQELGAVGNFMYLRTNLELAGNILNIAAQALDFPKDENDSYNIFNIPFSQYAKGDADFRYYRVFDSRQSLVFRAMGGLGLPYGNVSVLPFIKSYYGGGANGLRAWRIYSLGPGSYRGTDEARFDRYGDIKLEANVEYRFRFYRFWHGAFFADAGNVWFVRQNSQFPGGEFRADTFLNEIALGGGLGVRMDFDFFVLRIDAAVPLKDPAQDSGSQWIGAWPQLRNFNLNLGIGYPF